MEAEKSVAKEVVERRPGAVPVIGKFGMSAVAGNAEAFPFGYVGFRDILRGVRAKLNG